MKVDSALITAAAEAFRAPYADSTTKYIGASGSCPTSTNADAMVITWWHLYHRGRAPQSIATSRGHSYRVVPAIGCGPEEIVTVDNWKDHREGVRIICEVSK